MRLAIGVLTAAIASGATAATPNFDAIPSIYQEIEYATNWSDKWRTLARNYIVGSDPAAGKDLPPEEIELHPAPDWTVYQISPKILKKAKQVRFRVKTWLCDSFNRCYLARSVQHQDTPFSDPVTWRYFELSDVDSTKFPDEPSAYWPICE